MQNGSVPSDIEKGILVAGIVLIPIAWFGAPGVISGNAFQAGNAALGVAYAARQAGVPCSVMVMDTAPAAKVDAINRLGASIVRVTYDEAWATVERHASSRMRGYLIHPFDDDRFIAGNATLALEILEDLPDADAIVGSVGGGGLLSGVVSAVRAGDAIMIKGSLGSKMKVIVNALEKRFPGKPALDQAAT